jgi:hypothetical protein
MVPSFLWGRVCRLVKTVKGELGTYFPPYYSSFDELSSGVVKYKSKPFAGATYWQDILRLEPQFFTPEYVSFPVPDVS